MKDGRAMLRLDGFLDNTLARMDYVARLADPLPLPDFRDLCVVGTWDGWRAHSTTWCNANSCFLFTAQLGKTGQEKFQIWLDGTSDLCIYPDQTSASPYFDYRLCGPDGCGDSKNWHIGRHPLDRSEPGSRYRVRVFLSADRRHVEEVDWVRLCDGEDDEDTLKRRPGPTLLPKTPAPVRLPFYRSVAIVGSWGDFKTMQLMQWNPASKCYYFALRVRSEGWEEFQIVLDCDFGRRLYPGRENASMETPHRICGPDSGGDGKNWALWPGEPSWFEIRLHLTGDGSASRVDWVHLPRGPPRPPSRESDLAALGEYSRVCIVGFWNDWQVKDEMRWDAGRRCYAFVLRVRQGSKEDFQILLDGDWSRCLHPDRSAATPFMDYKLCGPDDASHGLNWTVGGHASDRVDGADAQFEVRLLLSQDCSAATGVDWLRVHE